MRLSKKFKKSPEKREESQIDMNSKSFIKSSQGDSFAISLLPKPNNRRTKIGNDLTANFTANFITKKGTINRNKTISYEDEKKESASETESSLRKLEHRYIKNKIIKEEKVKSQPSIDTKKTIVDNINNIYSKIKKIPKKIKFQNYFIFSIATLITIFDWSFLFQLSDNKLERNYCFTNLYQFDSCSINQICKNYNSKINYVIYNKSIDAHGKDEKENTFLKENNIINSYYKQFFLKHSFLLSSKQVLNNYQIFSSNRDKSNFAIILSHKGQWNYFLRYFSICQKYRYSLMIMIIYVLGGFFGCIIFGFKADIHGRKKLIKVTLFITNLGLVFCIFFCYFLDGKLIYYRKQFNKNYTYISENEIPYRDILEDIYVQNLIRKLTKKIFIVYLASIFVTNLGACPLLKICLSLLLENSTNEEIVLTNYRTFNFCVRGVAPLLASILIVNFNNITLSYTILFFISFILFISSFFVLNESMRYYYEFCEWKNLSNFIMNNFVLEDTNDIQFLEPRELREFQREENIIINKEYEIRRLNLKAEHDEDNIFEVNNFSNYLKRKISSINRKIKRKADIILKLVEVKYNPLIIHICIKSNKMYFKSKFIVLSALLLLNLYLYFLCYEMIQKPFFREKDIYIERGFNFIFNSNFVGLFFSSLFSNYFYYYLYRIYCFRTVIIISSLCISFLSIIYHLVCLDSENTPLYYNQYNFSMMDIYYKDKKRGDKLSFIYIMYFAINGICIYIDLILIKMSKTIYRCTVMTDQTVSLLISLLLTRAFSVEINRPFLLLGFINFIFLFIILFLDEMTETPNIVNDLKQNVEKKVKHFKSE